jgi:glycosyltransferase involved in cell wall biosynthesis
MTPEVTVLMPFHREPDDYFFKAVESVNASENVKLSILLIDDRKAGICKIPTFKNSKIITTHGVGYANALNEAKSAADTEYVGLMNSDDLIHPRRFILQIQAIMNSTVPVAICGIKNFGSVWASKNILGTAPKRFYSKSLLQLGAYGANATLLAKNDFFRIPRWENIDMSDWKFALDFYPEEISLNFVNSNLYFYRRHSEQVTQSSRTISPEILKSLSRQNIALGIGAFPDTVLIAGGAPFLFPRLNQQEINYFFEYMQNIFDFLTPSLSANDVKYVREIIIRRLLLANGGKLLMKSVTYKNRLFSIEDLIVASAKFNRDIIFRFLDKIRYKLHR